MPPKRKTVAKRKVKGSGPKLEKFKEGAKKVWKYVKDKKLISKGLSAISPFLGPELGMLTQGASTVASLLGAGNAKGSGLSLPGGAKHSHPYRSCCRCGLASKSVGSGLLLAGQKANPRPRIVGPDCHEVVGSGARIIGNRAY